MTLHISSFCYSKQQEEQSMLTRKSDNMRLDEVSHGRTNEQRNNKQR